MKKTKTKICAIALTGALALSAVSVGFAAWKTDITASGSVTANGKWDVSVTDADMAISHGATATLDYSSYQLMNQCSSANISQVALQVGGTKATYAANVGKHTSQNLPTAWVWLVDTTRFDMDQLGYLDSEPRRLLMLEGTEEGYIIRLDRNNTAPDGTVVPALKGWYGGNTTYAGTSIVNIKTETAESIVDDLITESDAVVKQLRPDTYQNYALVLVLASTTYNPQYQFVIASMGSADGTEPSPTTFTETDVTYADVNFSLPGAWAKYSLTVTNNGTVNANLSDITCELVTEQADQLVLDAPDLESEVLKPGESCTLTYVVKVPADYEGELNASGTLNIKLPYSQDTVEEAPVASHTHD